MPGAHMFCRIRGYLSTCRKQHVSASQALNDLFNKRHLTLIAQAAYFLRLYALLNLNTLSSYPSFYYTIFL